MHCSTRTSTRHGSPLKGRVRGRRRPGVIVTDFGLNVNFTVTSGRAGMVYRWFVLSVSDMLAAARSGLWLVGVLITELLAWLPG